MKQNDLQIMQEMWLEDIELKRSAKDALVMMTPHIHGARIVKQGGVIEMGVDGQAVKDLLLHENKWLCMLWMVNKDDFFRRRNEPTPGAPKQATEERDKAVELLDECRLQLEYLDKRSPTGTTPNILNRIELFLNSLNASGSVTGEK